MTQNSNDRLEDILSNSNAIVVSDLHGSKAPLAEAAQYASMYGLSLVSNGDDFNDYNFMEVADQLGYTLPTERYASYMERNLSQQDFEALMTRKEIEKYGVENFINVVSQQNQLSPDQAKQLTQYLENVIEYTESEMFQRKIQDKEKEFINEEGEAYMEDKMKLAGLYEVMEHKQAQEMAETLNEYGVPFYVNKGNHDSARFYKLVQAYMDNPDKLVELDEQEGYTDVNGLKVGAMSNSVQYMPYLSEIFGEEEMKYLYSHLIGEENMNEVLIEEGKDREKIKGLEKELLENDSQYRRVTNNGDENGDLDLFLTHGPVGTPYLDESKEGYSIPYRASAALLAERAGLVIEGHIHSNYEGRNSFGDDTIRPGNKMYAVGRDTCQALDFSQSFNPNQGIKYSNEELEKIGNTVEALVEQYKSQMSQEHYDKAA